MSRELSQSLTAAEYRALMHQGPHGETLPARAALISRYAGMNRLEQSYAAALDEQSQIQIWWYESLKFKLADRTFYTPDFLVQTTEGFLELHEVKGFWRDDARVKWKTCAALYPQFRWIAVQRIKGQWQEERL